VGGGGGCFGPPPPHRFVFFWTGDFRSQKKPSGEGAPSGGRETGGEDGRLHVPRAGATPADPEGPPSWGGKTPLGSDRITSFGGDVYEVFNGSPPAPGPRRSSGDPGGMSGTKGARPPGLRRSGARDFRRRAQKGRCASRPSRRPARKTDRPRSRARSRSGLRYMSHVEVLPPSSSARRGGFRRPAPGGPARGRRRRLTKAAG